MCLALCGVAGGVLFVVRPIQYGDDAGADPVRLEIPSEASLGEIAARLHAAGVVQYPFVFKRYAMLAKFDRQVRTGEYEFVAGESYRRILERLRTGDIIQIKVTFPEGLTRREIAEILKTKLSIDRDEFLRVTEDPQRCAATISIRRASGVSVPRYVFLPDQDGAGSSRRCCRLWRTPPRNAPAPSA